MCHNLYSFFQVLVKALPPLQQLNYFPERLRGTPSLSPSSSAPTYRCETSSDSTHHRKHTQPLSCWKLTHCQFFHQIIILQIIFKTLELCNVCSLCYKELQKIDTLLNTRSGMMVLGLVFYTLSGLWGTRGETEKLRAVFKGRGVWNGWELLRAW